MTQHAIATDDQVEAALRAAGGIVKYAAEMLGYANESGLRHRVAKNERFQKLQAEIQEANIDIAETQLMTQLKAGNMTAVIFYLKTKGKRRGYVERYEQTGPEGGPINSQVTFVLPDRAPEE